jgi:hypothetical protein
MIWKNNFKKNNKDNSRFYLDEHFYNEVKMLIFYNNKIVENIANQDVGIV